MLKALSNWFIKKVLKNPFYDKFTFQGVNGVWFGYYPDSDTLYTEEWIAPVDKALVNKLFKDAARLKHEAETVKLVLKDRKKIFKGTK